MYDETRRGIRRALEIGKVLFSLGPERYEKLVEATSKISPPSKEDLSQLTEQMDFNEAVATWFRQAYIKAATDAGFEEKHGIAVLSYAALLKDLEV